MTCLVIPQRMPKIDKSQVKQIQPNQNKFLWYSDSDQNNARKINISLSKNVTNSYSHFGHGFKPVQTAVILFIVKLVYATTPSVVGSVTWAEAGFVYYPLLGDDKERLLIDSARLQDAGEFKCVGKNRLGSASRRTILTVNGMF